MQCENPASKNIPLSNGNNGAYGLQEKAAGLVTIVLPPFLKKTS
jgi:hypothetical protein